MLYSQADIIKHHRTQRGLTQGQLAEGICSRFHIVKAEAGTRKLSAFAMNEVLMKLGLNPQDFNWGIDIEDNAMIFFAQKEREMKANVANWDREGLMKIKADIDNFHETLESSEQFRELLMLTIDMHLNLPQADNIRNPNLPKPDIAKARAYATQAIEINRPKFDLEKIDTYYLTLREYALINTVATTYGYLDDLPKEVEILAKLKASYDKNQKALIQNYGDRQLYFGIITNIAINCKLLGMWEDCLEQATENMDTFLKHNDISLYARALYQRAYSLMKLERLEEGKSYYNKFFMLAYILDGHAAINFDIVKKEYEDVFGGQMEIKAEW